MAKGITGVKRRSKERERDRAELAQLYCDGWTIKDLSDHFGVSMQIICRDMNILRARWIEEGKANYGEWINRELITLDKIEVEAWAAWEKSLTDSVTVTRSDKDGNKEARTGQSGNPKFLEIIAANLARRAKLLGYDAPSRADVTSGGAPVIPVIKFGDEQNERS